MSDAPTGNDRPIDPFDELRRGQQTVFAAVWSLVAWIAITLVLTIVSGNGGVAISTAIATLVIAIPAAVVVMSKGFATQRRAARRAADQFGVPQTVGVPLSIMRRGEGRVKVYAERAKALPLPQPGGGRMNELRNAVPRFIWRLSAAGVIVLVAGIVLSIGGGVVAVLDALGAASVSALYFFLGAVVCYVAGVPLMLSFARYFKKSS